MPVELTLSTGDDASPVRDAVLRGLSEYNARFLDEGTSLALAVAAREEAGEIVGGATGRVWHDRLFVDLLWVAESHRHQDLGTTILRRIETEARTLGATRVLLDTFSFQAPGFYEKQGYREVARLPRFFGEHDRIYLEKGL